MVAWVMSQDKQDSGFPNPMIRLTIQFMGKHGATLIKVGVTAVGLIVVFVNVPAAKLGASFQQIHWGWVGLSFVLIATSLAARAVRWLALLRGLGVAIPFGRLVELYFVGNFFNAFLPSGFGGDVVRALEAAQDVSPAVAAGTVIVDRLTGLLMLFALALLALPFRPAGFPDQILAAVTAVSLIGVAGGVLLLDGRLARRWGGWLPGKLSVTDETKPLAQLLTAVQGCGWPAILQAMGVSILFNLMLISWWAAAGKAMNFSIPITFYFLVVPILSVALLIPSISGLGVRETIAPLLFAPAGLAAGQAVALSLLVFTLQRASSLMGAPIYLKTLRRQRLRHDR